MNHVLKDLSAPALVNAIEENLFARFTFVRFMPQAEVHDGPDLLWSLTDVPLTLWNSVLRARLAPEEVDAAIDAAISRCRARRVPMLWWTGPSTLPTDLGTRLQQHGFEPVGQEPGMAAELSHLDEDQRMPSGASVVRVTNLNTLRQWTAALRAGFGASTLGRSTWWEFCTRVGLGTDQPFRYYYALLNGTPVATSMVLLAAGVAGVYAVATVPEARRQGLGAAVTTAALHDARALGYRVGVLGTSEMGEGLYRRLGFREYCKIGRYVWRDKE